MSFFNQLPTVRAFRYLETQGTSLLAARSSQFTRTRYGRSQSSSASQSPPSDGAFEQLIRNEYYKQDGHLHDNKHVKKVELGEETASFRASMSPFRNPDGSFVQGTNSEEARLDPKTLRARVDSSVVKLPSELSEVISRNILSQVSPGKLRERVALIYQRLDKEQIQKAPDSSIEADAHIAALFLQNFSHAKRVLLELKKRVGDTFCPDSVLDVGYGPATGMLALNEVMGNDFSPSTKEVYVIGRASKEMKKRAKILLSRQINEIPDDVAPMAQVSNPNHSPKAEQSTQHHDNFSLQDKVMSKEDLERFLYDGASSHDDYQAQSSGAESENGEWEGSDENDDFGAVDTSQIRIKTKLRDALPSKKQYELIIVNQSLLSREHNFPKDVDVNLHMLLSLLKPDGHLVIIERGNALGFEIVARARQVMLRPESHKGETGCIPRPYIRGSSIKPQRLRKEDQMITEDHVKYEESLLASMEQEDSEVMDPKSEEGEQKMKQKLQDLEIKELEHEALTESETKSSESKYSASDEVDYHLSVVAPCSHHGQCPLQLGDPKFYKISNHEHRLQFCSFDQVVERPKYTMELKKGRRLATAWDKGAEDGFGTDQLPRNTLKRLEGSGRPGGNNSESGSFSYLIMHRSKNDEQTLREIHENRTHLSDTKEALPRIIEYPNKVKKNVKLNVCAPSGNIELWQIPRSFGKQAYHDARKAKQGDLWALGRKSAVVKSKLSEAKFDKLRRLASTQRKFVVKEKRKRQQKKLISHNAGDFDDPLKNLDMLASDLEQSKKYRIRGKRAGFDVDPEEYEGK